MKPTKILDVHSHMFNLKYLPVAGILVRLSGNKINDKIARGIEWLFLRKTKSDFETTVRVQDVTYQGKDANVFAYQLLGLPEIFYNPEQLIKFSDDEIVNAISNMATKAELIDTLLSDAIKDYCAAEGGPVNDLNHSEVMTSAEETKWLQSIFSWLQKMLNWVVKTFNLIKNNLRWFIFMTNSEIYLYKYLRNTDAKELDMNVHLMMDVDAFFEDTINQIKYKSYFDFESQQVPNMEQLNKQGKGSLIGFVAFNPAKANWQQIIEDAITKRGFKGVKFYPPMGYKAYLDPNYGKVIEAFLDYCDQKRIPILTHCNCKGFEAQPKTNSGYNSSPVFWEKALLKRKSLILCLGHGGGSQGWFTENRPGDKHKANEISAADIVDNEIDQKKDWNKSYAAMVFKLCVEYANVYCDASYLDEMILPQGGFDQNALNNFKTRLLTLFKNEKDFSRKIMYGSDWHMLFNEGINYVYLKDYIEFFDDKDFEIYVNDFFYNNAMSYLNSK